jgi:transporter family-2 protein
MPWWGWLGALVGAGYVTAVFLMLPQIGAAATIALTVAGQQLAGLAVDQYGLLRLPRRPVSAPRLLGIAVLLAGVGLLQLV